MKSHAPLAQPRQVTTSSGKNGAAQAPRAYGIDLVDRGLRTAMSNLGAGGAVLQARWLEVGPFLRWEPAEGGTWWFDPETRLMAFSLQTGEQEAGDLRNLEWKPHKQWQMESLAKIDPDAVRPVKVTFEELVTKGAERWNSLERAQGGLDPQTQGARDWFFAEYYNTRYVDSSETSPDGREDIESNYNARPESYALKVRKGEYQNTFKLSQGLIVSSQTYALGGQGEMYYNPKTGNQERMPPSEIYYQQWRQAAQEQHQPNAVLRLKQEKVAGDALPMLKTIRAGAGVRPGEDAEFAPAGLDTPRMQGFLAMLAIPNVTASVFLIRDHGRELGIRTIMKIVLTRSSQLEVYFR